MMDNVSYVQGLAQPLVIIHQCLSGSCVGGEGHERLVYIKYTWSIGNCATWCNIPTP